MNCDDRPILDDLMEENAALQAERDFYQKQAESYRKGWLSRGRKMNGTGEFADLGPMHDHETVVNLRRALADCSAERIALADTLRFSLVGLGMPPATAAHVTQDVIDIAAPLTDGVCSDG